MMRVGLYAGGWKASRYETPLTDPKSGWLSGRVAEVEKTFYGRAYGLDIRIEQHDDGTLSAYEAQAFSGRYVFVLRDEQSVILKHFDVSGSIKEWLERK